MLTLAWLIIKAVLLLIIMAIGGIMVAFGITFRFVMGLEAHPSTIARFAWLCWGLAGLGVLAFIYAGSGLAQIAMV
ncbi:MULTISPECIES: hypothetical protein [Sphingobium]|uniref:hypothetical protein n=1 Tax=Sphingobium TaxID=165695 RepID=UPI000C9F2CB3|nr:hypothetical protein [Sphingobium sp. SA916]PNP99329.1 hypothetical protein A8G00_19915 [Sphingobium sp. SA916]